MVMQKAPVTTETIYLAGGCLWGVQEFVRHLPGVLETEAGRANGTSNSTGREYDGYSECVRMVYDPTQLTIGRLLEYLFEIIDPYSINQQGPDVGKKYRTGIYSHDPTHLSEALAWLRSQKNSDRIAVEVLPLTNYVRSDEEHQDRLKRYPEDNCHLPKELLHKYKRCS